MCCTVVFIEKSKIWLQKNYKNLWQQKRTQKSLSEQSHVNIIIFEKDNFKKCFFLNKKKYLERLEEIIRKCLKEEYNENVTFWKNIFPFFGWLFVCCLTLNILLCPWALYGPFSVYLRNYVKWYFWWSALWLCGNQ